MIAVIFEARVDNSFPGAQATYLAQAEALREEVLAQRGLISIERFSSLQQEGKLLSLSYWESEAAVAAWRDNAAHQQAQHLGRTHLFADYTITIAQVIRRKDKLQPAHPAGCPAMP